ncbi:MAG: coenzyme F420-0:L-glutamate ligase [Halobacteriota archaeon]
MAELTFHGLDIGLVEPGDDLIERILETTATEFPLEDGDVVVCTSKVVSIANERLVEADSVTVDDRARRVAAATGLDPREVALIYEESAVLGAVPVSEIAEEHLMDHTADDGSGHAALEKMPAALLTERNGRLCSNAGIDWSNTPPGTMARLPKDPDASARRIREAIAERTDTEVAVILADSEIVGPGSMDLAIGVSGIEAIDRNYGHADLHGQPKPGGMDRVASELTAGSALLFGQSDERTPVVVVRGLDYESGEGRASSAGLLRAGVKKSLELTARIKAREWF